MRQCEGLVKCHSFERLQHGVNHIQNVPCQENIKGTGSFRRWLGYVNFTKVIFGVGSRFPETSALSLWLITEKQSVALRLEVRFIDESELINKRKGFIIKDNPDWEIDFSISLDLADSLDDISDFEATLTR